MTADSFIVIGGEDVRTLLEGQETTLIDRVGRAYAAHQVGKSSVPHSSFLRFPDNDRDRIIALPAWLGDDQGGIAGIKWIASFPRNVERGLDRASAVMVINSMTTGQPIAVVEASTISAKRTAASAALAAGKIHGDSTITSAGLMGCGVINFEIARFLLARFGGIEKFTLYDVSLDSAERFGRKLRESFPRVKTVDVFDTTDSFLGSAPLLSVATNAGTPHISNISACAPGTTILHISLRDISASAMLEADHVVDDVEHVCRERTSVHLASESKGGDKSFIRATIGELLLDRKPPRRNQEDVVVYSPFGLGILDVALASFVVDRAKRNGIGHVVDNFLPVPWRLRED